MTTLDRPSLPAAPPSVDLAPGTFGVFRRPDAIDGWRSWFFTVDHKRIGLMYGVAAISFFVIGGIEALLIRIQLAGPDGTVLSADVYNQMFTMHATTMIFLFAMPMAAAFANYLVPLQIGARDVAFPRLNAFSFWCFLAGGLFLNTSWLLGGAADGGWFMYAPNSGVAYSPSNGIDIWALGLQITGIASLVGAINLIVTVINMRAPGMTFMKMPAFTWMAMVTQFLLVFAVPVITVALVLLTLQRSFGATFFEPAAGADPLLWQHLFWIFGHPEVYILILPAFGITSEIIPVFSKKPLFGYPLVVFSGAVIGFVGFGVWAHHMFASGLGPVSVSAFAVSSMAIAIPTGIKIVNWTLTMWGGKLRFTVAMMFSIGLIVEFTVGGLSGVTHAVAPSDTQQTDTYYIVAHIHYVLFGGAVLGFFAAFYYWWPKVFGKCLSERLGHWNFWLMIIGMNLTFGPMHVLGLQGQPRRMYVWSEARAGTGPFDLGFWNLVASIGSFVMATGILLFLVNVVYTHRTAPPAPLDPWDARTLEWMTSNPPADHNWDRIPQVQHLDEYFHRKYEDIGTDGHTDMQRVATAEEVMAQGRTDNTDQIHLPSPSYWPLVAALALPVIAYGVVFHLALCAIGATMLLMAVFGWALEASVQPNGVGEPVDSPSVTTSQG
ncbi:MAG: cytochrome c oxidase subunit I [Ilumatobacter sp.]